MTFEYKHKTLNNHPILRYFVLFLGLLGLLIFFTGLIAMITSNMFDFQGVVTILFFFSYGIVFLYLASFKITIDKHRLIRKNLFSKQVYQLKDLKSTVKRTKTRFSNTLTFCSINYDIKRKNKKMVHKDKYLNIYYADDKLIEFFKHRGFRITD